MSDFGETNARCDGKALVFRAGECYYKASESNSGVAAVARFLLLLSLSWSTESDRRS